MADWIATIYHAYPVPVAFVIFMVGYALGYQAKSEDRPFWS
jgi:hypothetical protein